MTDDKLVTWLVILSRGDGEQYLEVDARYCDIEKEALIFRDENGKMFLALARGYWALVELKDTDKEAPPQQ